MTRRGWIGLAILCAFMGAPVVSIAAGSLRGDPPGSPAFDAPAPGDTIKAVVAQAPPVQGQVPPILEGPVDPRTYRLGPGDVLNIRIGVTTPVDHKLVVSPEGALVFPEGAVVPVAGRTIAKAESTLTVTLSRYYRAPAVQVNLLDVRTFAVFVVGQVARPGMVVASPADRASAAIARAGGTNADGSRRAIRLTRGDGEELPVDLGRFQRTGSLSEDPFLEAGDRIYVPPAVTGAVVGGAVRLPGPQETVPGDSVGTLIELSHGLREDALPDSAYIETFEGSPSRSRRIYLDLRDPGARRLPVHPRDLLFVRSQPYWTPTRSVQLEGEVRYPGTQALPSDSLLLTQVIALAGGFTEFASLRDAYVSRPLEKLPADPEFERLAKLPTSAMTADEYDYYTMKLRARSPVVSTDFVRLFTMGDRSYDVYVRPGDRVVIPHTEPYVMVLGEVVRPGSVPFAASFSIDDYIRRAGGYSYRAGKGRVVLIRTFTGEWVKKGHADPVNAGDTIWVPQKSHRFWKTTLAGIGILSQLATIYLVIANAAK